MLKTSATFITFEVQSRWKNMKYVLVPFNNLWKLYIGIIFAITLILFYPLFLIFLSSDTLKPFTFKLNVFWSRLMRILCFYGVEVEGESIPSDSPFILCANHTSYLDIFLMLECSSNLITKLMKINRKQHRKGRLTAPKTINL